MSKKLVLSIEKTGNSQHVSAAQKVLSLGHYFATRVGETFTQSFQFIRKLRIVAGIKNFLAENTNIGHFHTRTFAV